MARLVLFDIDETMLYSDGVGRRAMEFAMQMVLGRQVETTGMSMSGKTDPQICHEVLSSHGLPAPEIDAHLPALFGHYLERLPYEIDNATKYGVHQGVHALLSELSKCPWAHLGLLTGNIEDGARLKLEPVGLNSYFAVGAYGSDAHSRLDLPAIAAARAQKHFGLGFAPEAIVIIGDAVADVLCAKGYGAVSLAVNTGRTTREALSEHNPDFLFASLSDTGAVVSAIQHGCT